ncbi:MAG: hypothetical protein GX587_16035 [Bacteroidales bacterium]|nr:hypothetical protein [Bacteroidales bacterium]
MIRTIFIVFFFPAILIIATGCTAPVFKTSDLLDTGIETKQEVNGNQKVCISSFEAPNNKPPENIVGKAKVGFFNMPAPIKADTSVETMVTDLITSAFISAGFKIVPCSEADFTIKGTFDKIWVDEYATGFSLEYAKSHVKCDIMVNDYTGKTIWANSIDKFETSPQNMMDATSADIPTLQMNLKNAIGSIFTDESFWEAVNTKQ